jgi:Ser/Thr protein kinase RdoA (MazF antagonist)
MSSADDRLPQGYTNRTRRVVGEPVVEKIYAGSDARIRMDREAQCLLRVATVVPVPTVVGKDEAHCLLRLQWTAGEPGQRLLDDGSAREVLNATGALLRHFQAQATALLATVLQGRGITAVHGDFGPQNLLFGADHRIVALLDWEFAHMGEPVEDLAWAEWIVRMHHPHATGALDTLFAGYGERPDWSSRHAAMLVHCERLRQRCEAEGMVDIAAMWRARVNATNDWEE